MVGGIGGGRLMSEVKMITRDVLYPMTDEEQANHNKIWAEIYEKMKDPLFYYQTDDEEDILEYYDPELQKWVPVPDDRIL